jgi:hypothetical protein
MEVPRLAPGAELGRYRLESLLGRGGMASVWKASDERLDRLVAIKVISETLALDDSFLRRFEREARTAARLSHPNLVKVFDFEAEGPRPYLVSEYIDGGTLAQRLEAGGGVDAGALARELLGALAHIHAAGVIHRDVKPANVLLDRGGHSRLTDFGIARPSDATALTDAGKVLGTVAYMAPEVRAGNAADERSDLYSCGVLLGECIGEGTPTVLRQLVARLGAEDPDERLGSAAEALEMLDGDGGSGAETAAVADTAPVATEPLTRTAVRPVAGARRPWVPLALAALLLLAGALVAVAAIGGGGGVGGDNPAAQTRPGRQGAAPAPAPSTPSTSAARPTAPQPVPVPNSIDGKALKEAAKAREKALKEASKAGHGAHGGGEGD